MASMLGQRRQKDGPTCENQPNIVANETPVPMAQYLGSNSCTAERLSDQRGAAFRQSARLRWCGAAVFRRQFRVKCKKNKRPSKAGALLRILHVFERV